MRAEGGKREKSGLSEVVAGKDFRRRADAIAEKTAEL
jgi:hypothetical protein